VITEPVRPTPTTPAATSAAPPVIETRGLVKRYDDQLAVAGIDLVVGPGEIFGLVGPNGAGKTTTMKILATLMAPTAGEALVCGFPVTEEPIEVRRRIGYMPDFYGVYDDLRVWEYLDFFARCYGVSAGRRATMIGELLEIVGLADKRQSYVESLSRGMRQRLCLAHTLVHDPQLLILDEPASGLDPRARVEMREILRELRAMGKTILVSSHILPELGEMCTGVGIIDRGQLLRSGNIDAIERSLRAGAVLRIELLSDPAAAIAWLVDDRRVGEVLTEATDPTGPATARLEVPFDGTPPEQAALLRAMVEAGHVVSAFSPATSDLEEIFLKVTGQDEEAA
jgi:ABC-2 type transport system ATP-binding protein